MIRIVQVPLFLAAGTLLLSPLCVAAGQQPAGTPIGGGAQLGTQPLGTQSGTQTNTPQSNGSSGDTLSNAMSGAQGIGTGPSGIQAPLNPTLTTDRALLFPSGRDLQLTYGDLLAVRVYGEPDYTPTVRIGTDGQVLLPLIGIANLQGLSITAAEELIAKRLRDAGMFKDPQVTVQLLEGPSAFVTVIGEAHGIIPVNGPRRLLDVLAASGGLPATASHVITINRPGQKPLVVDLGSDPQSSELANIPIFPGDTVVVAHLGIVYIVGEFKTQGAIPLTSGAPMTLLQATALSGGPVFTAKYDDLRLIRTTGQQRTVVKLDIHKVLYGKSPDPILQAGDIIFLPSSALKQAIQSGGVNALLTLANLAVTSFALTSNR